MAHTNTWESEGLYRKFTGETSGVEILHSNFELHEHPKFKTIKYIINDFLEAIIHQISPEHAETFARTDDMISVTKGDLKIALIVIDPSLIILAKHYREQMKNERFECEIFQTVADSRKWIDQITN